MAGESVIEQGLFTSTGAAEILKLRFDPDWIYVYNLTELSAANAAHGLTYFANSTIFGAAGAAGNAIVTLRNGAANAVDMSTAATLAVGGISFIDQGLPGAYNLGPLVAATAITNNTPPRVTGVNNGVGFSTGDVIRMYNPTGAQQFGGFDFEIAFVTANRIDLRFAPTIIAGTNVTYRKVPFAGTSWYPSARQITAISQANNARVTFSVTHRYVVGQKLLFGQISAEYGMTQISGLEGTITAIGNADANGFTNTVDVDINSTAFTAFAFPLTAVGLANTYNIPAVFPAGENTAAALLAGADILSDSQLNNAFVGLSLAAGITSPAGSVGDQITWIAGSGPLQP